MDNDKIMALLPWLCASAVVYIMFFFIKKDLENKLSMAGTGYVVSDISRTLRILMFARFLIRLFTAVFILITGILLIDTTRWLRISWDIICLGLALCLQGHLFLTNKKDPLADFVKTASGVVSGAKADTSYQSLPHASPKYRNIITYTIGGVTYNHYCDVVSHSDNLLQVGTRVVVHYNTYNPKDIYLNDELKKTPQGLWALLPVGVVIVIVGVVMAAIAM